MKRSLKVSAMVATAIAAGVSFAYASFTVSDGLLYSGDDDVTRGRIWLYGNNYYGGTAIFYNPDYYDGFTNRWYMGAGPMGSSEDFELWISTVSYGHWPIFTVDGTTLDMTIKETLYLDKELEFSSSGATIDTNGSGDVIIKLGS